MLMSKARSSYQLSSAQLSATRTSYSLGDTNDDDDEEEEMLNCWVASLLLLNKLCKFATISRVEYLLWVSEWGSILFGLILSSQIFSLSLGALNKIKMDQIEWSRNPQGQLNVSWTFSEVVRLTQDFKIKSSQTSLINIFWKNQHLKLRNKSLKTAWLIIK